MKTENNDLFSAGDCLLSALVGLVRAVEGNEPDEHTAGVILESLRMIGKADAGKAEGSLVVRQTENVRKEKFRLVPDCAVCKNPCGRTFDMDLNEYYCASPEVCEQKKRIVTQLTGQALRTDSCFSAEQLQIILRALYSLGYCTEPESLYPLEAALEDIAV